MTKAKFNYFRIIFERNKNNLKNTWKHIKTIALQRKSNKTINKLIINNEEINNPKEIAEALNDFFSNIASSLETKIPTNNLNPISFIGNDKIIRNSFFLNPMTINECSYLIKGLKNTKQGLDAIPVKMIKECSEILSPILTNSINLGFKKAVFPTSSKKQLLYQYIKRESPPHLLTIGLYPYYLFSAKLLNVGFTID